MRHTRKPAFLLGLSVALMLGAGSAQAEKVGVAAAVNPDAFSSLSGTPNQQLNIGKSIFYNERINTTTSGLVQVLLVDGSTFTVGPNSNLVIDRFVYDPRKKTGELVATFSKGTMRFIGGKLSKNEGGVTVNTPSGALAIRGGMVQATPTKMSFLYGVAMTFTGRNGQTNTVYETGYTLDLTGGTPVVRPTTSQDTNFFMSALSNGNTATGTGGTTPAVADSSLLLQSAGYDEIIDSATATQIQDEIQKQLLELTQGTPPQSNSGGKSPTLPETPGTPTPEPTTASFGYAGGIYLQTGGEGDPPVGTLSNLSPTEVGLLFGKTSNAFKGADFKLFADANRGGSGGARLTFVPTNILPVNGPIDPQDLEGAFAGIAGANIPNSMTIFDETVGQPPQLSDAATLNSGQAGLAGFQTGELLCDECTFMKFGSWGTNANFTSPGAQGPNSIVASGYWVAGDLPTIGELPIQGYATYEGVAYGMVSIRTSGPWQAPYGASGKLHMGWSFADRAGILAITDFDKNGPRGPLNVAGVMTTPGVLPTDVNQFSGGLTGAVGKVFTNWNTSVFNPNNKVTGAAIGSFAANGPDKAAGVIGNWNAKANNYRASGVFGGVRNGPIVGGN